DTSRDTKAGLTETSLAGLGRYSKSGQAHLPRATHCVIMNNQRPIALAAGHRIKGDADGAAPRREAVATDIALNRKIVLIVGDGDVFDGHRRRTTVSERYDL